MRSLSRSKFVHPIVLALVPLGSGFAGALLASSSPASSPTATKVTADTNKAAVSALQRAINSKSRPRPFDDAATLQSRAAAGEIEAKWLLTPIELSALQTRIDRLTVLWEATTRRLHERMATATLEMIERGELQSSVETHHEIGDGLIGRRWTVRNRVPYEKAFYPGDDGEVDALQHRREILKYLANRTAHAAFN